LSEIIRLGVKRYNPKKKICLQKCQSYIFKSNKQPKGNKINSRMFFVLGLILLISFEISVELLTKVEHTCTCLIFFSSKFWFRILFPLCICRFSDGTSVVLVCSFWIYKKNSHRIWFFPCIFLNNPPESFCFQINLTK